MPPQNPPHDALRAAIARGVAEHGPVTEVPVTSMVHGYPGERDDSSGGTVEHDCNCLLCQ